MRAYVPYPCPLQSLRMLTRNHSFFAWRIYHSTLPVHSALASIKELMATSCIVSERRKPIPLVTVRDFYSALFVFPIKILLSRQFQPYLRFVSNRFICLTSVRGLLDFNIHVACAICMSSSSTYYELRYDCLYLQYYSVRGHNVRSQPQLEGHITKR